MRSYQTFDDDNGHGLVFRMDFDRDGGEGLVRKIEYNVRLLNEQIGVLESWIPRLSANSDEGERSRNLFNEKAQRQHQLCRDTNNLMKQLVEKSHADRSLRSQRERLSSEYTTVINRLQAIQRKAAVQEKNDLQQIQEYDDGDDHRQADILDSQRQAYMQRTHQVNLQEIKERTETMAQLEREISDVNQIFAELARIVHDQGEIVDSIEANVDSAQIYVEQGARDVQQAVYYNEKARKKKMLICVFLSVLALILGLTVYFGIKR